MAGLAYFSCGMAGLGLIIGGMAGLPGNGGTRDFYINHGGMAGLGLIISGMAGLKATVGCGFIYFHHGIAGLAGLRDNLVSLDFHTGIKYSSNIYTK